MSKQLLKTRWLFLPLLLSVMLLEMFLPMQTFAKTSAQSATGNDIVAIAQAIVNGQREPGWPGGSPPPYSWFGGHNPKNPVPSYGVCQNWKRPTKPAGAPQFSGPNCQNLPPDPHDKYGNPYGSNGTFGVDCSGLTRWVYDLAWGSDVLKDAKGFSDTKHQIPLLKPVSFPPQPGDLVFFGSKTLGINSVHHVGIYIGNGMMIDAPHTYDPPHSTFNNTNNWVQTYVRTEPLWKDVYGYYRYIPQVPKLASSYSGTVHNITYNITAGFALSSITEDQSGNISGQATVSLPLYGSGPFTGTVRADNTINFTVKSTDLGGHTITFTGTVNQDGSLSGNYTVDNGQTGTWSVS